MNRTLIMLASINLVACAEGPFELADADGKGPEGPPPACGGNAFGRSHLNNGDQIEWGAGSVCTSDGSDVPVINHPEMITRATQGTSTRKLEFANCDTAEDPAPYTLGDSQRELCDTFNGVTDEPTNAANLPAVLQSFNNDVVWQSFTASFDGVHSLDSAVQNSTRTLCDQDAYGVADPTGGMQGNTTLVAFGEDLWLETYVYTTLPDITLGGAADLWEIEMQSKIRMNYFDIVNQVGDNYKHWTRGAAGQWATGLDISEMDIIYGLGLDPVNDIGHPVTLCFATMINTDDLGNAVYPKVGDFTNANNPNGGERLWEVGAMKDRIRFEDTGEVSYVFTPDTFKYNVCDEAANPNDKCFDDLNVLPNY